MTNTRILIVDDHGSLRKSMADYLRRQDGIDDVREAAKLILGGGGGQPGLATAGGKSTDGLSAAIAKLVELATA